MEAIYIIGDSCSTCHHFKAHVEKRCEQNGYSFNEYLFDDDTVKEFEITSVPMLILREDGVVKQILNQEGIVHLISNK